MDVGCDDVQRPAANNSNPSGDHADDTFDVASRFIELEQLDPTKELWKDIYGRTGIKKGYIGLFLEKELSKAYQEFATAKTEAEFNQYAVVFQAVLNNVQAASKHSFEETYYASPDVALLSNGFVDENADLLLKRIQEPIREIKDSFNAASMKNQPVLVIPSGGFMGLNSSTFFKSALDEYVRTGGTVIVFSQQHGYDYSVLPTPDGIPLAAYGWAEDQNCFWDGSYLDSYHQTMSSISTPLVSAGVDGYFTSWPTNATILLRRTANGQPALLMYDYGQGKVIVSSFYSDWGAAHAQATKQEIAIVRDLISWGKKPAVLPEIKLGETVSVPVTVSNSSATEAASIKFQIYTPDRSLLLNEQSVSTTIPVGGSSTSNVTWQAPSNAALGIYHIDYLLLDAAGTIIQPQAETDSGRFVISNPPQVGTVNKDIWLSITSPNQEVFFGEPFLYTFHIFNNSATTRNLTLKSWLPHTNRWHEWPVSATANGETTISGSDIFTDSYYMFETLRAYLYDENNVQIGSYMLSFKGVYPSVDVTTTPGKGTYAKGETVALSVNLKNGRSEASAVKLGVTVTDPANNVVYGITQDLTLDASGTAVVPLSFTLPVTAQTGVYAIATEVLALGGQKVGGDATSFEHPLSQITVIPTIPAALAEGANNFSFTLNNSGKLPVASGSLDVSLQEPDGAAVAAAPQPFTLDPAQGKNVSLALTIPPLKFGVYTLAYNQGGEGAPERNSSVFMANSVSISANFDKPSYRIRETANLALSLKNSGRFNLTGLSITVTAPDAGYSATDTVNLAADQSILLSKLLPIPETVSAGQHAVTVTLTLPSGSSTVHNYNISVPQSSLSIGYADQDTVDAGHSMSVTLENSGGTDTVYGTELLTLTDVNGVTLFHGNVSGVIRAGETKSLIDIQIPSQAVDGPAYLNVRIRDGKNLKILSSYRTFNIKGLLATLSAKTSKTFYAKSDAVTGITTLANGQLGIEDGSLKIQVTGMPNGDEFRTWISGQGAAAGQFDRPRGLAIAPDGALYVSDTYNNRIQKFDANGHFITAWGSYGSGNGQFDNPRGIAFGQDGSVFIADGLNSRVQKFDKDLKFVTKWGSYGSGNGQFWYTSGIAMSHDGYVFVVDPNNHRIQKFDANGNFISKWGSYGSANGQFTWPSGIAMSPSGLVYVADTYNSRIQVFDTNGNFVKKWGSFGVNDGQFKHPYCITTTSDGMVYVADTDNNRIQKFDGNGNFLAKWGSLGIGSGQFDDPEGIAISPTDSVYVAEVSNNRIQRLTTLAEGPETLFETIIPVSQSAEATRDYTAQVDSLNVVGKLYLTATLTNNSGQLVSKSEYPFYIAGRNALLSFTTDKKFYKPGETVTIGGEVKNLAAAEATNLSLVLKEKPAASAEQSLYSAIFTLPAGGSRPFSLTTMAGAEGTVAINGVVTQNGATLAEIADQYEAVNPQVTGTLTSPDVVGDDPFNLALNLANSGKIDALITVTSSITSSSESVTIPAGQTKLLQYTRQIAADTTDSFTISGDLTQIITKTVKYGPAVALSIAVQALYPEGKVSIPVAITNSGLLDSQYMLDYQLAQGAATISQQSKGYFLPKGSNSADTITYDLLEGSYQLVASSRKPAASVTAAFQVRKDTKAELTLAVGIQSGNLLPATVNVTNLGFNPLNSSVRLSLADSNGAVAWATTQDVSLPQTLLPAPQSLSFSANLSTLKPGNYTVKAELLDNANRQLAFRTAPFNLLGPTIAITQIPPYRSIPAGGTSDFTFRVKNSGNQEGKFDLQFKADDLVDATRSEWLKPGEEKEITFALQAASDLDEKDYFAVYSLKLQGSGSEERGTVRYRLLGLNLAVTASLDRQAYNPGDTATLSLTVTQQDSRAAPNLFARVNYNGYNEKRAFKLNGSQTLTFNVPLSQITGEKLFYGIYAESGRSIHLNTMYVHKADAELAISTDKQVYNPDETVTAAILGIATGELTLTGPGGFTTTFAYSGSDTRSFTLPATMTAGTYTLNAQLKTQNSQLITVSYPFDVAGIQVKVKEALLDKTKYAATDAMQLSLTIESNQDFSSTVRTWVVDPSGSYTEAGSSEVTLTAIQPLLFTLHSSLVTGSLGIHKLVYGIYQGDLLLASGAKAFDIGEAVLMGLATDRTDYPEITLPVTVKADLYGTTTAAIELFLDGVSIRTDNVTLSGAGNYTFAIPSENVAQGLRVLKAVLSAGGLTSSKETRFTYGSRLPDLTGRITAQPPLGESMNLSLTVTNQGKTAAGASRATLYDGDPANVGLLLATLDVPAIGAGSSVTLSHTWNILGRSGEHVLHARIDSDNSVAEFIEANNTALTAVSLPSAGIAVSTGKSTYGANEAAAIAITLANLTANLPIENSTLKLRLTSDSGAVIDLPDRAVGSIAPATAMTLAEVWNTGTTAPAGYTITARLVAGETEIASGTFLFTVVPTAQLSGSITPAVAEAPQDSSLDTTFTVMNSGNIPIGGTLQAAIKDPQSGITMGLQETALQLPVGVAKTGTFSFPLAGLPIKGYGLLLGFVSGSAESIVAQSQFSIIDTIPPTLTVSALSDGSYTNSETLNVAGTVSDNSGDAKVEINSATVPVAADGTFSQAVLLQSGGNTLTTVAADGAGNKSTDSRTIILDKAAPALTITAPADNSKTAVSPIEVKGSVDETSTVTVKHGESVQTAAMNGTVFSATVIPEPGLNTIELTATDLAGNVNSLKRSVLFDDQAPSLAITEPNQDIRTNRERITIGGNATDPYTAVGVTLAMDGNIMTPPVVGGIFSQIVAFGEEKLYPITVTATNEVGTQVSAQRNVIFDKTPPSLTIDPVATPTNSSSQIVTGTREEGTAVEVSCATATVGAIEYPAATTWRATITGMQQGENRLRAEVNDLAGNRTTATATILYVPKAPEVTLSASPNQIWPPNKQLMPVTIAGNVVSFGSDIREVTLSVADEYGKYNLQGLKFGDTLLLEAWRDGNDMDGRVYTITAVVTDQAGNRTTRSTTVVVPHDMGK